MGLYPKGRDEWEEERRPEEEEEEEEEFIRIQRIL